MKNYVISSAILATLAFASCQRTTQNHGDTSPLKSQDASVLVQDQTEADSQLDEKEGYQSFAFYEGIPANGIRSLSRSDGTSHGMPCVTKGVIARGEEVKYNFWHGHNRELHRFTLTSEDLAQMKDGKSIEVFTAVVDGHKHAVKIDLKKTCRMAARG